MEPNLWYCYSCRGLTIHEHDHGPWLCRGCGQPSSGNPKTDVINMNNMLGISHPEKVTHRSKETKPPRKPTKRSIE